MRTKSVRNAIVITASRLFYKQGYSNTGINQIIEEAHISKSALYQHFPSKEDLLMAYLEKTGEETITALRDIAQQQAVPQTKLLAIFEYLEKLVQEEEFYGCHFLNMVYEIPEDATRIRETLKKQKDNIRILFTEILAPIGKEAFADEVYTLFEGALIGNKIHSDPWPIISAKNTLQRII